MSVDYLKANENIVEDSKNLLLWQFENATNLQKMVEIIAEESSGYEQVAEKIFTGFLLASAEGVALDSIGEFLNFPRDGQSDAEYRTALVFSSIGAQSTIARDDVTNLINIVTGGIGGYFYRGRYHDLYIYLQQSCIDKGVATEFIDKYLPINTNASIIFESGNSFGFEGNDAAAGFDRVRALPAEGEVALQYTLEDLDVPTGVVIPNGDTFTDSLGNIYRTDGDTDLETTMRGFKWGSSATTASYDNISFDISSQDTVPSAITFNNDGTKMFIVGTSSDSVHQYTLTTAFDISTASYDNISFDVSSQETSPTGMSFNNDGTRMFIVGRSYNSVHQYTLTTAFDISTASYDNISFDVSSQETYLQSLSFNNDGTKMFIVGYTSDLAHEYTLTTAFDISTASYDNISFDVSSQETSPTGISFNNYGTKMFIVGASDSVHQYTLTTAFDISTASYDNISFDVSSQETSPTGMSFNNDGTKMFIVGYTSDSVHQYTLTTLLSTSSFTTRNNFNGSAISTPSTENTEDTAFEVTKALVENNTIPAESMYLSEATLYVGYETLLDASLFLSRSTQATEYNAFQEQASIVAIDVARKTYDATTGDVQAVFYENASKNLLPHGNYPDDVTGDWTVAGTVAAQGVDAVLQYINGISSVTYDLAIGASVSVSKAVLTERVGLHSFSFYLLPDVLTYTVSSRANSYVFSYDGTSVTDVSSDFNSFSATPVIIEGRDCLRVTITDEYSLAEDADLEIYAIADQSVAATLQVTCAQFEPWSVATSYIPTQGGAQERAVDIFALTEDPAFNGAVEDHTFIFNDAKGDVTLWSQGTLVAAYKEAREIPVTTVFTPVETYGFTLLSTTALSGWSDGLGDEGALIDDDVSYSESGRLCSRTSLTSRDVLGLTEIGDSTIGVFEYELDSRFAEVISFVSTEDSYARPIVVLEQFREFRSPDWDDTVIDPLDPTKVLVSGVALRSPQATTQVASPETSMKRFLAKVDAGDAFSYTNNVGDIDVPNNSFYFELQLTASVASSAIDELYASADFSARQETTEASVVTTSDTTFRAALVSEYRDATSDYEVAVYVVAVNRTSTVNQVSGESSELDYEVVGKSYSQVYSDPLNAEAITAGFVVDPVQNVVRLYIDGQSYDGNSGIVLVTSLGANHNDAETIVGDVLTIPVTTDALLFQIGGSTNADNPEPTSVVDYGSIRFNYSQEHFQYVEQLPQNTLDIFGRVIDNGA